MNYNNAIQYIEEKNKLGIVPGLDSIRELLRRLGNPERKCRALHIAGTNGKGSIFAFVEQALIEAGYKVGRYISPTIFTYLERFQINKINMDEEDFADIISEMSEKIYEMEEDGFNSPTAFEIETAAAYMYFAREKCDFMLIECGMGGEYDATNVLVAPLISVIARVSMDHMNYLGDTIEKIAENKAGIIKKNSICVSTLQRKTVIDVLERKCRDNNSKLIIADDNCLDIISENLDKTIFSYKGNIYETGIIGEHQVLNAATAIEVLKELGIKEEYISKGIKNTVWMGRMTRVCKSPLMYVDGAHNEEAWMVLKHNVNKYFTNKRIIYIIGVLKDKEYQKMVDILCDSMEYAITITPNTPRGLDKNILAALISKKGVKTDTAEDSDCAVKKAFSYAEAHSTEKCMILVCGSLSFIADYMNLDINKICM